MNFGQLTKLAALILPLILLAPTSHADGGLHYLSTSSIDLSAFPPPPADGSKEDIADLNVVRRYQKTRTKEDCARANREAAGRPQDFYGDILTEAEIAKIETLYEEVSTDTDYFVNTLKPIFNRKRPYVRDSEIKLCVPSHPALSYPSGHSAIARSTALVLGELFHDRAGRLKKRSKIIARDRAIGAVHHPKDTEAGMYLGDLVHAALMKSSDFRKKLDLIRAELKADK